MPSLFKRTKNLIQANSHAAANDTVAPSIRSVVEMRQHLAEKHADLLQECRHLTAKISDYQHLVSMWAARLEKAAGLMTFANDGADKLANITSAESASELVKYQEMSREFSILQDTAREYVRIYSIALEKAKERRILQQDTANKMVDTLYRLQSFERKYSLKESLSKTSAELSNTITPGLELQETREINRTLHTAEALLELKEADYGWNFPALPG